MTVMGIIPLTSSAVGWWMQEVRRMQQSACTWKNLPLNVVGTICISLMEIVCTPLSLQSLGQHGIDINCVVIWLQ
jgi:hypothetical protein